MAIVLSDSQQMKLREHVKTLEDRAKMAKSRALKAVKDGEVKTVVEAVGAAAAIGYMRGLLERQNKQFVIPGTEIDAGLAIGAGLIVAGMTDLFGKYDNDAINAGAGILAASASQLARNSAKNQKLTFVGGVDIIGGGG